MRYIVILAAFAFVAGCGNGDNSGAGPVISCDLTKDGGHTCTDFSWSGGQDETSSWQQVCATNMGTTGSGCSHAGAGGACKRSSTKSGITQNSVVWFYDQPALQVMEVCQLTGDQYVAP